MLSAGKVKPVNKRIPRDSGFRLSMFVALCMLVLFGMEMRNYLKFKTVSSAIFNRSADGELLHVQLNISFPALPCEFVSVDVNDVLGTNQLNITKTIRKFPIDPSLQTTGSEFYSGHNQKDVKSRGDTDEDFRQGSIALSSENFDKYSHKYPILVVKFYAPWCQYSQQLAPAWEKAAKIIRERYDPEMDGRILIGHVDCTAQGFFCDQNRIHGYPSIRIFRNGSDVIGRDDHEQHKHESYYGARDLESLVGMMESLVSPATGGCRIEGFLNVKKVPGNLIISARSASPSFDSSKMDMSHIVSHFSFGNPMSENFLSYVKRWSPYIAASHGRLDGKSFITPHNEENVTIEHYIQVIKTELILNRRFKEELVHGEYEYTAKSSMAQSNHFPVAKFRIEPSPVLVLIEEKSM